MEKMRPEKNLIEVEGNIIETLPIHCERNVKRNSGGLREITKRPSGTIEIDHHSRYWTEFDLDVIMAIFGLSKVNGEARKFNATKKDIANMLGLKYNPETGREINESMREIAATLHYSGSFYDVSGKKYSATGATHLFSYYFVDAVDMKRNKISGRAVRKESWISIGEEIWQSLKSGYYKIIDLETYKLLPRGWVRKTYLFIEKRLGGKSEYTENLESLIRSITGKEIITANDKNLFKRRTLKKLSHFYNYKFENGLLTITRAEHIACR
ncbi:MAG: hypothetical protein U0946_01535, partial [Patescibacteria group bacterium]|nr:hypothetical protein [Patescibacteria group bacterium]